MDPYQVLGVSPDAGLAEIKAAYKERMRACHPDRNKEEGAKEAAQEINAAYEQIMSRLASTGPAFGGGGVEDYLGFAGVRGPGTRNPYPTLVRLTLEQAYRGGSVSIPTGPDGIKRFRVPPGVLNSAVILLSPEDGDGDPLRVMTRIAPHPIFHLEPPHLKARLALTFPDLILGTTATLNILGDAVTVKTPPNLVPGSYLIIPGAGYPINQPGIQSGRRGDLHLLIEIKDYGALSDEVLMLLKRLSEMDNRQPSLIPR